MPRYEYHVSLYIESGEVEADDPDEAQVQAEREVREQFADALSQAHWSIVELTPDAT